MSGRPTLEELLEIQTHFGLPNAALVEKDWHVVKALAAVTARDLSPFRLVFGGGTALSRAHGLIHRMSEDIDLKVISDAKPSRSQLGNLRDHITDGILAAGFTFDPQNPEHRRSMYKNKFVRYRLSFAPIIKGEGALRPEIQIDTLAIQARRPTIERPVRSFIAEGYDRAAEVASIACSAIPESAAEKLVALTRRAGAELAGLREKRDPTLVRHVYDLHVIRDQYDAADVASLAREIMLEDARTYGRDFPAYQADPLAETLKAIDGIAVDEDFADNYASFCRSMVYGEVPELAAAMRTLKNLAQCLKSSLTKG